MLLVILYMALAILTVFFAITLYNYFTAPMLRDVPEAENPLQYASDPRVSEIGRAHV